MGKLDALQAALAERKNPRQRLEMVLVDDVSPKSAELTSHIDDATNSILKSIAQLIEQFQTAATRDNLSALTNAISRIQIPAPQVTVDMTPILDAIRELGETLKKPQEWKFKVKRNGVGGISEVVATAE